MQTYYNSDACLVIPKKELKDFKDRCFVCKSEKTVGVWQGVKRWAWCKTHEKQVKSAVPGCIRDRYNILNRKPIILDDFGYNEVIYHPSQKGVKFIGPLAKKWYGGLTHETIMEDYGKEIPRLWKAPPGKKFLIYDMNYNFITETRNRNDAESYLNKERVLVWLSNG